MIVKCEKCQARFRIRDEKIAPGGVRLRCTKCKHIFSVKPDVPLMEEPAPVETPREGESPTRPGLNLSDLVPKVAPLRPSYEAQKEVPANVFAEKTRIGHLPDLLGSLSEQNAG